MTYKIPANLVDTNAKRLEEHQLMIAGPGMTAQDIKDARAFLERRAALLGKRLAGAWHLGNGTLTVWVHA